MVDNTYFFYDHHIDLSSAISMISKYLKNNPGMKANIAGIHLKKDIEDCFLKYKPERFKHKLIKINPAVFRLELIKKYATKHISKTLEGKALLLRVEEDFFIVVSIESLTIFKSVVLQFLSHYYIELSRAYLDSQNLRSLLNHLKEESNGTIISNRIIAYERKPRQEYITLKKSAIIYTKEDYNDSFEEAIDKDQFIDKIDFILIRTKDKKREIVFNGHLSREGIFRVDNNFSLFYESIIQRYKDISKTIFNLFKNRERKKEEKFEVKPLEINYSKNIFEDKGNNYRFINMLKAMHHISLSCYHCNPYISLSVLDYLDGSSLDIWVLDPQKIILIPQTKCTSNFLSRFVKHIFENFREGLIKEFGGEVNA